MAFPFPERAEDSGEKATHPLHGWIAEGGSGNSGATGHYGYRYENDEGFFRLCGQALDAPDIHNPVVIDPGTYTGDLCATCRKWLEAGKPVVRPFRLPEEDERRAAAGIKEALRKAVALIETWQGYGEKLDFLRECIARSRNVKSVRVLVSKSVADACTKALGYIIEEAEKPAPCIPDFDRAEKVANALAQALFEAGFRESATGAWVWGEILAE